MDDVQFIIISATGRSGSTTMQRIISTIPDSNINGENADFIGSLLNAYKHLKKTHKRVNAYNHELDKAMYQKKSGENSHKPQWKNTFDLKESRYNLKKIIYDFLYIKHKKVLGFKEVRFGNLSLLDEFIELFPNTKIILHCKEDTYGQTHSESKANWWKPEQEKGLKARNADMKAKHRSNPSDYYYSSFENMFNIEEMRQLFDFLGYKIDELKYNEIINNDRG